MPYFINKSLILLLICFCFLGQFAQSQEKPKRMQLQRVGWVYGYGSSGKYIRQDSDYRYDNQSLKISTHFLWSKKNKHRWEVLIEPTIYRSKHESFNPWQAYFTSIPNADEMREKFMPFKRLNEYSLNFGVLYRRHVSNNFSVYTYANIGPMYIDTETERIKKGFAFSDIIALGVNYRIQNFSVDMKTYFRHVSNANLQWPNYGLNSVGFELGVYYEILNK